MLRMMLIDLWRRSAWLILVLAVLATVAPLRLAMAVGALDTSVYAGAFSMLQSSTNYAPLHAVVAVMSGLLLGVGTWQSDVAAGHVYALTLPTPRWHYALMRYIAGLLFVMLIAAAFWIGALVATSLVTLPTGLQAYPSALAVRFALTALLMYALFFTLGALTTRTAAILLIVIAVFVSVEVQLQASSSYTRGPLEVLFNRDHLLAIGRWMLFDV